MSCSNAQLAEARRINILIVEDDMINAFIFQKYLTEVYNVYLANTSETLSDILHQVPIDLILMDINLDSIQANGAELLPDLRANFPWQQFKAVALTAFSEDEYKKIYREVRFDAFCQKPLTKEKLLGIVESTLKQSCV
ncbi:MAG: response regulator [Cytophagales bacterium]|nr:response regulator [Bernardetiaceae bacterium]MDW8205688.1 response regulator [Cytophagales bacterium]